MLATSFHFVANLIHILKHFLFQTLVGALEFTCHIEAELIATVFMAHVHDMGLSENEVGCLFIYLFIYLFMYWFLLFIYLFIGSPHSMGRTFELYR